MPESKSVRLAFVGETKGARPPSLSLPGALPRCLRRDLLFDVLILVSNAELEVVGWQEGQELDTKTC